MPFQRFIDLIKNTKQAKNYLLYCAVGERSSLAVQVMQAYDNVTVSHLIGGFKEWINQQMPIITHDN